MPLVSIVARVVILEGRGEEYLAAFEPLLEQAERETGTLLYAVHRSNDDPHMFWTTEIYADESAFSTHVKSDAHAAAAPIFTELIAQSELMIGETVMAAGLNP